LRSPATATGSSRRARSICSKRSHTLEAGGFYDPPSLFVDGTISRPSAGVTST
jgi:hypothetical protein